MKTYEQALRLELKRLKRKAIKQLLAVKKPRVLIGVYRSEALPELP